VLWKTLEQWHRRAGLGQSPRTALDESLRIQNTDIVLWMRRTFLRIVRGL
jgi:hypothetical protein